VAESTQPGYCRLPLLFGAPAARRYDASGAYYPSDGRDGHPFEWHGRVQYDGYTFVLEGSYRHKPGASENRFYLELSTSEPHAASGNYYLHCPHLNDAAGSFRSVGAGLSLGGRAAGTGTAMSLSVEESPSGTLECRGALVFASGLVWLVRFQAVPAPLQEFPAEVVELHSRSRH